MEKYELGLRKKSFSIFFNNGEIWCEHLDSMEDKRELIIDKFNKDMETIKRPSTSAYIAIVLAETEVDEALLDYIFDALISMNKQIRKVAIVGLDLKMKRYLKKKKVNFQLESIDDFEKAKKWLV